MKTSNKNIYLERYKTYFGYGAASLLAAWLIALLNTALLPGPYRIDFFGVVAEKTTNSSSVTVGWAAFLTAFIFLPLVMIAVDYFKDKFNK